MSGQVTQPTIRTIRAADVPAALLGTAGVQHVLFGTPRADDSPILMGVSQVRPGMTTALIQHDTAELAYVVSGEGYIVTDRAEFPFAPRDGILIESGCWHAIRAGDEPVEMLFVFPTPTAPDTRVHAPDEQ
jgi:gentisate 1,2-dioxygenase